MLSLLYNIIKIVFLVTLPFSLLIRGAVWLHYAEGYNSWVALAGGVLMTTIVLFIYFTFLYESFTGNIGKIKGITKRLGVILVLVFGFALHSIAFISSDNTKTSEVKKEYRKLHPILRLGVSTLFIFDKKGIITDAARLPEDYRKMGLKRKRNSLHYRQKDGYAYAIDIRTKGRSELRNLIVILSFRLMGFKTLRHFGTADHLHVSMKCRYLPWAI